MEKLLQFFQNLGQRFQELTPTNKAVALGLLALILGSVMAMSLWLQEPDYQLLYANLSEEDASAIYEQLQTQNVKPQLSNNGRTIHVPSNQVHELRLKLAGQGLPKGHEVGLELFEDMPLGMTEFIQKLNFQRALVTDAIGNPDPPHCDPSDFNRLGPLATRKRAQNHTDSASTD